MQRPATVVGSAAVSLPLYSSNSQSARLLGAITEELTVFPLRNTVLDAFAQGRFLDLSPVIPVKVFGHG
jgi:hypothetical protein